MFGVKASLIYSIINSIMVGLISNFIVYPIFFKIFTNISKKLKIPYGIVEAFVFIYLLFLIVNTALTFYKGLKFGILLLTIITFMILWHYFLIFLYFKFFNIFIDGDN